ncbi:Hypothetical predicted protein [Pelobates cultripes]|uniref:Uncharacterized protein n=1 Tax=Pelobates cultripes TaxID=61616 RepID=A0AAD1SI74_PELCU|nr:Hypothetical predicted protein [Pelobates cultripes]
MSVMRLCDINHERAWRGTFLWAYKPSFLLETIYAVTQLLRLQSQTLTIIPESISLRLTLPLSLNIIMSPPMVSFSKHYSSSFKHKKASAQADTDTSKKDESAEDGCQENQFLTVQALEARLQAGLLFLQELQHDIQVKDRVIKTSCESLTNMTQGKDVIVQSAEKEGLTSLWDDSDNCPDSPSSDPCTSLAIPDCFVEKVWYRVIDDLLVVGVKLSNSVYSVIQGSLLALVDQSTKFPK